MKLSAAQANRVQQQIDCQVIPTRNALAPQLKQAFGDHTFFLDAEGLSIVEPSLSDGELGNVVKLANWADERHTTLAPTEPEPTPVVVQLGPPAEDGNGRG